MLKHHIVILAHSLYPSVWANDRILYRIIDELKAHEDLRISIIGLPSANNEEVAYPGCEVVREPYQRENVYAALEKRLGKHKWLRFLLCPRTICYRLMDKKVYSRPYEWEVVQWVKTHRKDISLFIAMSAPYQNLSVAAQLAKYVPTITYKLEPVGTYQPDAATRQTMIAKEMQWDAPVDRIITTSLILRDYLKEATRCYASKNIQAEFPCVIQRQNTERVELPKDRVNMVFAGRFYAQIRHPQFLFELMDRLTHTNMLLHIVGGAREEEYDPTFVDKYLHNHHTHILNHGMQLPDVADAYLMQADVLVHVGNTVDNVMPSKILDYISTGKPILNICKSRNCPTIPLMAKYPMALTLFEDEGLTDAKVEQIIQFVEHYHGQTIPFDTIEQTYEEFTPKYVGRIFYQTIQDVINKQA